MKRYLLLLLLFMQGCKTVQTLHEQESTREGTELSQEHIEMEETDFLSWSMDFIKENNIQFEKVVYDTTAPPDHEGNYPVKERITASDTGVANNKQAAKQESKADTTTNKETNKQESEQDNLIDKAEQNVQSKPQQWTKLIWAVVALLVVSLVIYNRLKR